MAGRVCFPWRRKEAAMEVLKQILSRLTISPSSTPSQKEAALDDSLLKCKTCQDRSFILISGKVTPCPVCVTGQRQAVDWFAGVQVPTQEYARAVQLAKDMAYNPSGWLVLQGGYGTGKTTLAKAIMSQWAGKEKTPITAAWLLESWRQQLSKSEEELLFAESQASVAVLDDQGAERPTEWAVERLTMYLDLRYGRRLPTVLTLNADENQLAAKVGGRIADRVFDQRSGLVRIVSLAVPSFRTGREW